MILRGTVGSCLDCRVVAVTSFARSPFQESFSTRTLKVLMRLLLCPIRGQEFPTHTHTTTRRVLVRRRVEKGGSIGACTNRIVRHGDDFFK